MPYAIVVADVHVGQQDQQLDRFLAFLEVVQNSSPRTFYILGDLFTIWLGTPKMQLPYHARVVKALQTLQAQGIHVNYVEGNRDYFLAPFYLGAPFSAIASEYLQAQIGGKRMYFAHGDLVNAHDKQYRLWRRISKNRAIYACFKYLPQAVALRGVHYLEQTFRETNRKNKAAFPVQASETYAHKLWQAGYDTIILGHFHEERHQEFVMHGATKALYVLPAWKDAQTYLQINAGGECAFRKFGATI